MQAGATYSDDGTGILALGRKRREMNNKDEHEGADPEMEFIRKHIYLELEPPPGGVGKP
jgi:hypothetical protein